MGSLITVATFIYNYIYCLYEMFELSSQTINKSRAPVCRFETQKTVSLAEVRSQTKKSSHNSLYRIYICRRCNLSAFHEINNTSVLLIICHYHNARYV
jgi:hypothetical protein